jgi:hypothetical protein
MGNLFQCFKRKTITAKAIVIISARIWLLFSLEEREYLKQNFIIEDAKRIILVDNDEVKYLINLAKKRNLRDGKYKWKEKT